MEKEQLLFRVPTWRDRDIISIKQFDRRDIDEIMGVAEFLRRELAISSCDPESGLTNILKHKILANLFYEPSTRTSSSFASAMHRLGGSVISINEVKYSSVTKGESLPDTIRTLENYADVIVLRHPDVGSAELAAKYASKPIINAGDGLGEHPTQALLDLYTIFKELGGINNKTITMVGDLKHGRTVHSLVRLLNLYNVKFNFVSPSQLAMPDHILNDLTRPFVCDTLIKKSLSETDVLYITRVQKERFQNKQLYEFVKDTYIIDKEVMKKTKENMILMHPFPRVGEISMDVDDDPRSVYFKQMKYGLCVRMALLTMVLS